MPFTWDDNGNLLNDGTSEYTYNHANRLNSVEIGDETYKFDYSGLGDRLRQTVNGAPVEYTLDLAAGLTQVLYDGTNEYLYGVGRIGERQPEGWQYHLGDALTSVRQLADPSATVGLAQAHEPFGSALTTSGVVGSIYAFAGEQLDGTGLVYLRARYLASALGRFLSRDRQIGDALLPGTQVSWVYVRNNPATFTDASGQVDSGEEEWALRLIEGIRREYDVHIEIDFGWRTRMRAIPGASTREWDAGRWTREDLSTVESALIDMRHAIGLGLIRRNIGGVDVVRRDIIVGGQVRDYLVYARVELGQAPSTWTVVNELAHYWDWRHGWALSQDLEQFTEGTTVSTGPFWNRIRTYIPGCWPVPACIDDNFNAREDFAESVAAYVYPIQAAGDAEQRAKDYALPQCSYQYWGVTSFLETKRAEFIRSLLQD